jgi:uncharacterized membrane protein YvbJ
MNKTFCPNCGSKIEYGVSKPKFCTSCGKEMDASTVSASESKDDEEETVNLPSLDRLEIEIIGEKRIMFNDVANQRQNDYPYSTNQTRRG